MANSAMTFTYDVTGPIKKILASWTSDDGDGTVSGSTKKVSGYVVAAVTDPGTAAPTANYDIALNDPESVDIVGNCDTTLANRHTTSTERVDFVVGTAAGARPATSDVITIAITNAGNSKTGQVILYIDGEIG
jgi:hypothetical protein